MGEFKDLGEIAGLELPLRGRHGVKRVYRIPPLDAELGPTVQRMLTTGIAMGIQAAATPPQPDDPDTADERDDVDDADEQAAVGEGADGAAEPAQGLSPEDIAGLQKVLLSDEDEQHLFERVLGLSYEQMMADGVPWVGLKHAALVAMFDAAFGRDAAITLWQAGPVGKPPGRTPASTTKPKGRRGTGSRTTTGSTAGTTTRKPGKRKTR
jgi:hypothetical protein